MEEISLLIIPTAWNDIKDYLLLKLASMGESLMADCLAGCQGENREYLSCWFMFQSAAADYMRSGEDEETRHITNRAKALIHFICTKLGINYTDPNIDFSEVDFSPDFN